MAALPFPSNRGCVSFYSRHFAFSILPDLLFRLDGPVCRLSPTFLPILCLVFCSVSCSGFLAHPAQYLSFPEWLYRMRALAVDKNSGCPCNQRRRTTAAKGYCCSGPNAFPIQNRHRRSRLRAKQTQQQTKMRASRASPFIEGGTPLPSNRSTCQSPATHPAAP